MKLTVSKWFLDSLIPFLGKIVEVLFRIVLCLLPLGVYMFLIQQREKASKISNISVFTNDRSVWQHVFPGFILIAIEPTILSDFLNKKRSNFQNCVQRNKYIIAILFMIIVVGLMLFSYVK